MKVKERISSYPTGQKKITLFAPLSGSELDKMSYPPSNNELANSCYLILTSVITALFYDLIGKADKTVYLINYVVYFGGN